MRKDGLKEARIERGTVVIDKETNTIIMIWVKPKPIGRIKK